MRVVIALIIVPWLSVVIPIRAQAEDERHLIHLSSYEILRTLDALPTEHPLDPTLYVDRLIHYLERKEVGVGSLFTLVPAPAPEIGKVAEIEPPRFAFVARTGGRTLVSLTKFGSTADQEDRVLHQRWLLSDLLKGRQYSMTVYNEHSLDKDALRFLGVGARLMLRPDIKFAGWRFNFEMYGSYHPDHAGTAYLALTGKTIAPAPLALPGASAQALQGYGPLIPLRW